MEFIHILKKHLKEICFEMEIGRNSKNKKYNGSQAMEKLLRDFDFHTVLDIGCGQGKQTDEFLKAGKCVTAIDIGESVYFKKNAGKFETIIGDYNSYSFQIPFDCIWCSHVLEHQLNVQLFLEKINGDLREGGVLSLTAPPLKNTIVGGHVNLFNAGLLLYRLILAGFDCKEAAVLTSGYNISVIVKKIKIEVKNMIAYDCGDIRILKKYFPQNLKWYETEFDTPFYGNIQRINW